MLFITICFLLLLQLSLIHRGHAQDPALIQNLTVNGIESKIVVNLNDEIEIVCKVSGQPIPRMILSKVSSKNDGVVLKTTGDLKDGEVNTTFRAKCSDNGRYRCVASNQVRGKKHTDTKEVIVYVMCPPTACSESDNSKVLLTTAGKTTEVTLCVVSHPAPNVSAFSLEKDNNGTWIPYNGVTTIEINASDGILNQATVTFLNTNQTNVGYYRLFFMPQNADHGSFFLHFQLSGRLNDKNLNSVDHDINNIITQRENNKNIKADKDSNSINTTIVGIVGPLIAIMALFLATTAIRIRRKKSNSTANRPLR